MPLLKYVLLCNPVTNATTIWFFCDASYGLQSTWRRFIMLVFCCLLLLLLLLWLISWLLSRLCLQLWLRWSSLRRVLRTPSSWVFSWMPQVYSSRQSSTSHLSYEPDTAKYTLQEYYSRAESSRQLLLYEPFTLRDRALRVNICSANHLLIETADRR